MAKKKRNSNSIGWVIILGLVAFGIFQFTTMEHQEGSRRASSAAKPTQSVPAAGSSVPLSGPRYVNVASLNVRHTPSTSGPLIMALPRGTALRVLDRRNGWLLIDLNPTLEGWVAESLTTVQAPQQRFVPPASLTGSR